MEWSLDQLRQFVTAAECGSFSAAARKLGRAQSAVSTAISLFEIDLGVELFDRSRRNAQLTDAGQLLLLEAREVLRQAEELGQRAQFLASGDDARIALALDEALPRSAVNRLIRELSARYPTLELTLLNGTPTEVTDYIDQERAELAIHFERGPLRARFDGRHVGTVAQGVFVAAGHPLLDVQPVGRRDLARHRQLVIHADDVEAIAYSPKVWRSDSFYNIAEMVADSLGWAILPTNIAATANGSTPLCPVDCPSLALPRLSVRMLWRQGRQLRTPEKWIEKRFGELLSDSSGGLT